MPRPPLYYDNQVPTSPGSGHKGLWFDRFFNRYDHNWSIIKADPQNNIEEGKKQWINTVGGLCGDDKQLHTACKRQKELCRQLAGQVLEVKTTWHFATGLGNPHPVENGFAWHPTLGVPYLTGAAVKGLLRAWVEGGWMNCGEGDEAAKRQERLGTLYRWFGSEDMEPGRRKELREKEFIPPSLSNNAPDTEAGMFIFFDAIPVSHVELACDVMTPHYGDWYQSGGEINDVGNEPNKVPADWHSPVPVPFLVVKKAKFLFCIAPRRMPHDDEGKAKVAEELANVIQALKQALEYIGAGSKTAVGYGRMEEDETAMGRREMDAERKRMTELPTEERMRQEVSGLDPDQLATMFGKNFNKTKENKGENWSAFVNLVREWHGETVKLWATSPDKNRGKAFRRLYPLD